MPRRIKFAVLTLVGAGVAGFTFWAFHGTVMAVSRTIVASMSLKLLLLALVAGVVSAIVAARVSDQRTANRSYYRSNSDEPSGPSRADVTYRVAMLVMVVSIVLGVLSMLVLPFVGGFMRATALTGSVTFTDEAQPEYKWRTPWVVAAAAAPSRAGNVVGDFMIGETTFLPGTGEYATPVKARGFAAGIGTVVEQRPGASTASSCVFTSESPVHAGWFGANLNRALSFIDRGLQYAAEDVWVYCDGDTAKVVVPVVRMLGQPEAHPVPAGVVVYDGADATLLESVKPGEFPGPVYPSSVAAAQRSSLTSSQGIVDKVMGRAGFETSDDIDGDPNSGNVAELLLENQDGGWEYVTPLTPRGKSFTVTAVSSVSADEVTAGQLNPMTVYRLPVPREGNLALNDRVLAAFRTQLAGSAGLQMVEVIPTSSSTWEGTLTNGRAVANRVTIDTDGRMCLKSSSGKELGCVDADGNQQSAPVATGDGVPSANLSGYTDAELAELALDVAREQLRRATTTGE